MPVRIMLRNNAKSVPRKPPTKIASTNVMSFLGLIGFTGSIAVSIMRTLPISPALAILSC